MRVLRVFPRKTNATPTDENVRFKQPGFFDEADAVHVSCAFSCDLEHAERLVEAWETVAPTKLGGPATGQRGKEFTPGMYVKEGYTITSRGCPNKCWFCDVWKRDGSIRELEIKGGYNVLDDNLLACSEKHIRSVFKMLKRQKKRAQFTGGLEAARLKQWHVDLLVDLNPEQMFFAYDKEDDYEPLVEAARLMNDSGLMKQRNARCYVLMGHKGDSVEAANRRCEDALKLGYFPMGMLYIDKRGKYNREFKKLQREWARPAIIYGKHKGD